MHTKAEYDPGRALITGTAILLIAGWLRLGAFQEALVGSDQASILAAAADIAGLRRLPGVGIKSSIGVMQTAVTPYLAALPLIIVPKVIAVKWFFSMMDWLAVAVLFRVTKTRIGWHAAWVAALLYAANPWVLEFVRWIWYQSLISTFATFSFCFFLLLLPGQRNARPHLLMTAGLLSATLMGMVHLAALPWTGLLFAVGFILARHRKLWRGFLAGCGVSLLVTAPYLNYQVQTRFADVVTIFNGSEGGSIPWNTATYRLSAELLSGWSVLMTTRDPLWADSVFSARLVYSIMPVLVGGALACAVFILIRSNKTRTSIPWGLVFSVVWTLLAPSLFLLTPFHLQHFYLLFIFPAPFVIIGYAFTWLASCLGNQTRAWRVLRRVVAIAGTGAALFIAVWWVYIWSVRIGYEQRGKLRAPTRAWLMDEVVTATRVYLGTEPEGNVIIITAYEGDLSPFDWVRNFVQPGKTYDTRVRVAKPDAGFIIPAAPTCYMLGPGADAHQLDAYAPAATAVPHMTIAANPPWIFRCQGKRSPDMQAMASWQNDLSLIDAGIQGNLTNGGKLSITYTWHYKAMDSQPAEVHIFNHLMQDGELVAQVDGVGVPPWQWRDDDVLITHFTLPLPDDLTPGDYTLVTGFYTWPGLERILLEGGEASYQVQTWTYVCPECEAKPH